MTDSPHNFKSLVLEYPNEYLSINGKNCLITIEMRQKYCDRGDYLAKIFTDGVQLFIDYQDGWPRYYFDLERALLEVEAWLRKKGQMDHLSQWNKKIVGGDYE